MPVANPTLKKSLKLWNLEEFGITPADFYQDGVATNASTTFTSATANFTAADVGKTIFILRAGPSTEQDLGTTIASITNSTTVVLTNAPNRSQSNARFYIFRQGDQTSMIDAASAYLESIGGGIMQGSGVGYLASQINLRNRVWLRGMGLRSTLFLQLGNSNKPFIINDPTTDNSANNCRVSDCWVDGNRSRQTLPTTTLAAQYTAGDATISLTSGTNAPFSGRLKMVNAGVNGGNPVYFRYLGKSGNTLSSVVGGTENTSDATFVAAGTTVTFISAGAGVLFLLDPYNATQVNAEQFDPHHLVENVLVKNTKGPGLEHWGQSENRFRNVWAQYPDDHGFVLSFDSWASDCTADKTGRSGWYIFSSETKLANCKAFYAGGVVAADGHGFFFDATSAQEEGTKVAQACGAQDCKAHGLFIRNAQRVMWDGTLSSNSTSSAGTYAAVRVSGVSSFCSVRALCTERTTNNGQANALSIDNTSTQNEFYFSHAGASGKTVLAAVASMASLEGSNKVFVNGAPIWVKPADQAVINNATLQDDTRLQVYLAASTKYHIRGRIYYDTTAAGDMKYGFAGPTSPTLVRMLRTHAIAGAAPAIVGALDTALQTNVSLVGTGTTGGYIEFDCIFQNGANAGVFKFQFSQATATADTGAIVRAGSYIECWPMVT